MIYTQLMGRKPLGRERVDITLPKGMKRKLQEIAESDGKTLSELMAGIMRDYLLKRERSAIDLRMKK